MITQGKLFKYGMARVAQSFEESCLRNHNHFRTIAGLKDLLSEYLLVLDQEFSYLA